MSGERNDLIAELIMDHRRIDALCVLIKGVPWGDPRRKQLVFRIASELTEHAQAEARFLLPAVRRRMRDGPALAVRESDGQAELDHLAADLAEHEAGDSRFDTLLTRLVFGVGDHVTGQEEALFPGLADAAEVGELQALGEQLHDARQATLGNGGILPPEPDPSQRLLIGDGLPPGTA